MVIHDDETLLNRIQAGDYQAFTLLVQQYQGKMVNFALRHTGNRQTAEDLSQEAFARLFVQRNNIRIYGPEAVKAWLFRVLRNLCLDHTKRGLGFVWVPFEDQLVEDPSDGYPLEHLSKQETLQVLKNSLRSLSPKQREALYFACIEQLPYHQISKVMGTSVMNVKVLIHRARRRLLANRELKAALEEDGIWTEKIGKYV